MKPCLMASAQPLRQFPLAQGGQGLHVGQHGLGLVEGPHQVLALGQVHRHLAADGRVHHGGHAGGHLDEGDAPQEGGRHVAGQVAHHAAAHGQDGMPPLGPQSHQPLVDGLGQAVGLAGLTGRDDEAMGADALLLQGPLGPPPVAVHQVFVGDDVDGTADAQVFQPVAQPVNNAPAGHHGIAAARVVNGGGQVGVVACDVGHEIAPVFLFVHESAAADECSPMGLHVLAGAPA